MAKYRKKPVVIDAFLVTKVYIDGMIGGGNFANLYQDNNGDLRTYRIKPDGVEIETLEGVMKANIGDYIITGVHGEMYPCKPDIFEKTYEKVSE